MYYIQSLMEKQMQLYNLNTINVLWSCYNLSIDNLFFVNLIELKQQVCKFKNRVVNMIKVAILYTTLFVFLAGGLLMKGVSFSDGTIQFDPSLVIAPTLEALFGMFGFYLVIEMIKYAFEDKKEAF